MGCLQQNGRDLSYAPNLPEGAQALWAIQIATIDSLKWRGMPKTSALLGHNTIEHSFTRLAEIWCDKDKTPIIDPETGELPPAIYVRATLNPAAIDPEDGSFVGLRVDPHTIRDIIPDFIPTSLVELFSKAALKKDMDDCPKCKIGIFSGYDENTVFDAGYVVKEPIMLGNIETMESMWATYQRKAIAINEEGHDYHLTKLNCHTINAVLNKSNIDAVREFAERGFMRFGANPDSIVVQEDCTPIITSLDNLQNENRELAYHMMNSHQTNARQGQQIESEPDVATIG